MAASDREPPSTARHCPARVNRSEQRQTRNTSHSHRPQRQTPRGSVPQPRQYGVGKCSFDLNRSHGVYVTVCVPGAGAVPRGPLETLENASVREMQGGNRGHLGVGSVVVVGRSGHGGQTGCTSHGVPAWENATPCPIMTHDAGRLGYHLGYVLIHLGRHDDCVALLTTQASLAPA
jgi:hypothetical protein